MGSIPLLQPLSTGFLTAAKRNAVPRPSFARPGTYHVGVGDRLDGGFRNMAVPIFQEERSLPVRKIEKVSHREKKNPLNVFIS